MAAKFLSKLYLVINKETRKVWAEKTFELTNIGAGVLVFGQLVSGGKPKAELLALGLLLIAIGYYLSYLFLKGKKRKRK